MAKEKKNPIKISDELAEHLASRRINEAKKAIQNLESRDDNVVKKE